MNVDRAAIGRRIREIRIKKKISQETLAEYADIGACGYVSRIELGRALSSMAAAVWMFCWALLERSSKVA